MQIITLDFHKWNKALIFSDIFQHCDYIFRENTCSADFVRGDENFVNQNPYLLFLCKGIAFLCFDFKNLRLGKKNTLLSFIKIKLAKHIKCQRRFSFPGDTVKDTIPLCITEDGISSVLKSNFCTGRAVLQWPVLRTAIFLLKVKVCFFAVFTCKLAPTAILCLYFLYGLATFRLATIRFDNF